MRRTGKRGRKRKKAVLSGFSPQNPEAEVAAPTASRFCNLLVLGGQAETKKINTGPHRLRPHMCSGCVALLPSSHQSVAVDGPTHHDYSAPRPVLRMCWDLRGSRSWATSCSGASAAGGAEVARQIRWNQPVRSDRRSGACLSQWITRSSAHCSSV
jgi:hypothetical protein